MQVLNVDVYCKHCGKKYTVEMTKKQYDMWINKMDLIQNIFPKMDKGLRELLLSRTCPKCWDEMFGTFKMEE